MDCFVSKKIQNACAYASRVTWFFGLNDYGSGMRFTMLLAAGLLPFLAWADTKTPFEEPKEYSVVTDIQQGEKSGRGKMFVKDHGQWVRAEMGTNVFIYSKGDHLAWMLHPNQKTYSIWPFPKNMEGLSMFPSGTWEKVGDEVVEGRECEKWKCVRVYKNTPQTAFYWVDKSTHVPLQVIVGDQKILMHDFKAGPQDTSLFLIPSDYQLQQTASPYN